MVRDRTSVGLAAIALLVAGLAAAACHSSSSRTSPTVHGQPLHALELSRLVGGWRWLERTSAEGTTRIEEELWRFKPSTIPTQLVGRYTRDVEVRSDDHVPFTCNQRTRYRQRAVFDVVVDATVDGFAIRETAVRTAPDPCDHGRRKLGVYTATLQRAQLALAWAGGVQHLWHTDDDGDADLPADPWPQEQTLLGEWRWDASSYDDTGNIHDETEWWYVTRRTATVVDATYRRRVTVRSPDGSRIACANAPAWSFDDAYILDGQREEQHWHFHELAVAPGDHPCLRATPHRTLDEATAEQIGDAVILEWRGKRRQILYRPDRRSTEAAATTPLMADESPAAVR